MNFDYGTFKGAPFVSTMVNLRVRFSEKTEPRYADAIKITKWNVIVET